MGRSAKGPLACGLALGLALLFASPRGGVPRLTDALFALGSGFLIVGLALVIANLRFFAPALWGTGMLRRLFRGEAKTGREETEDYARFRVRTGGHAGAPLLLGLGIVLVVLSAFTCTMGG